MKQEGKLTLGSLFAGIGGFELAATWAVITPVWSNEIEPFACKVLTKNFSHEIIQKDIREIGKHNLPAVDIISGGFPCQPFSAAGKRQGTEDNRYLWPEMCRIIRELRPSWVIGENVAGLLSMERGATLKRILADLEAEGYNNEVFIIPACGKGAWHRRDRIWIVSNTHKHGSGKYCGCEETGCEDFDRKKDTCIRATRTDHIEPQNSNVGTGKEPRPGEGIAGRGDDQKNKAATTEGFCGIHENPDNSKRTGRENRDTKDNSGTLVSEGQGRVQPSDKSRLGNDKTISESGEIQYRNDVRGINRMDKQDATNTKRSLSASKSRERKQEQTGLHNNKEGIGGKVRSKFTRCSKFRGQDATNGQGPTQSGIRGMVDGIPPELDGYWNQEPEGVPRVSTGIANRADRLKGLGNAIVPQVAYELFKAIHENVQG